MTGKRAGTEADDGNMVQAATRGADSTNGFGERTTRIVIGLWQQRAADRRAIVVA